jgi:hypothetical protein
MPMLHDAAFREEAKQRVLGLTPQSGRRWGKMSVDQMLWHLNCGLENALGRYPIATIKIPLPRFLLKFIVLNLPWRKGNTPTAPELLAVASHDLEHERARTLALLDDFAKVPIDRPWGDSSFLGPLTGTEWSRLQGKHVDHHLRQFGV